MRSWRSFLESVHVLCLALWLGAVVMSGLVAARVFSIMKDLDPRLASHEAYAGAHWRLAGGKIANGVFAVTDVVQFICAFLAGLAFAGLVLTRGVSPRRISTWLRGIGLSVAMASLMGLLLIVTPQLNRALNAYWSAARAGNNDEAARFQALAGEIHPTASTLMGVTAVALLVSLLSATWSLGRGSGAGDEMFLGAGNGGRDARTTNGESGRGESGSGDSGADGTPASTEAQPKYPEPDLLRRRGARA